MGEKHFGRFVEKPGEEPKRGRGVKEIKQNEDTAEEAARLRGRRSYVELEEMPGEDFGPKTPEEVLMLKEAIREALDPRNKNFKARRLLEEDVAGLRGVNARAPKDALDKVAMERHSNVIKLDDKRREKLVKEKSAAERHVTELRKRSRGNY